MGAFCSIVKGVTILLGGEHHTEWVTTFPFPVLWRAARQIRGHPKTKGEIIIGNDVWIGQDALILSGVTIGDGAVIAARAVVTKNIEPYSIVAGNPARVIRKRLLEEAIARLLAVAWWAWTPGKSKRRCLCGSRMILKHSYVTRNAENKKYHAWVLPFCPSSS
jgi:acetyltransferase-like isoleucine patch superfamily enzyme